MVIWGFSSSLKLQDMLFTVIFLRPLRVLPTPTVEILLRKKKFTQAGQRNKRTAGHRPSDGERGLSEKPLAFHNCCSLVRLFPVLRFPSLESHPTFSTPRFSLPRFQPPLVNSFLI